MPIDVSETYAADPDAVLAVLTDETFLREWASALGARVQDLEVTATGGGRQTTVRLLSPTAGIPPAVAVASIRSSMEAATPGCLLPWASPIRGIGRASESGEVSGPGGVASPEVASGRTKKPPAPADGSMSGR